MKRKDNLIVIFFGKNVNSLVNFIVFYMKIVYEDLGKAYVKMDFFWGGVVQVDTEE